MGQYFVDDMRQLFFKYSKMHTFKITITLILLDLETFHEKTYRFLPCSYLMDKNMYHIICMNKYIQKRFSVIDFEKKKNPEVEQH